MAREAPIIRFRLDEAQQLQTIANARSTPQALAFRARLLLRCGQTDKPTNQQVAAELRCAPDTVSKWRRRFQRQRLDGLHDAPRSGRPPTFSPGRTAARDRAGYHPAG
jgi:transposase-like protein